MVKITGEYQGGLHCAATHGPSGGTLTTDAPKDNQGRGEAFSPTDLVATALVTCMATTMAIVAGRLGVDLKGLRYEVTKEMTTEGLMEKTAEACPVHQSLVPSVEKAVQFHWPA